MMPGPWGNEGAFCTDAIVLPTEFRVVIITLVESCRAHGDYETRRKRTAVNVDNDRR